DRRWNDRQGGFVPHLLVLACLRARHRRRAGSGPRPDGATAAGGLTARALRRGIRRRHRIPSRKLSASLLPPGPHRGGREDHRRRAARRALVKTRAFFTVARSRWRPMHQTPPGRIALAARPEVTRPCYLTRPT